MMEPETPIKEASSSDLAEQTAFVLRQLKSSISRVHHDLNNPLSIISGNTQYLLAMAEHMELEDDLIQAVRDIDQASQKLAKTMEQLIAIKNTIPDQKG